LSIQLVFLSALRIEGITAGRREAARFEEFNKPPPVLEEVDSIRKVDYSR
jgi:hypothetical protein